MTIQESGLTMIELMVTLAVLSLLAIIEISAYSRVHGNVQKSLHVLNSKAIVVGVAMGFENGLLERPTTENPVVITVDILQKKLNLFYWDPSSETKSPYHEDSTVQVVKVGNNYQYYIQLKAAKTGFSYLDQLYLDDPINAVMISELSDDLVDLEHHKNNE